MQYKDFFKTNVTLRITALWAFSESFMGGILHGLQIPFAGLALSFVASVCITLIALGSPQKGEILKASLLVIALKFILSPHTPPLAYLAVFIQGVLGEAFFLSKRFFKTAAFMLTLLSLLYSAFQQLLIVTILFGKGFWDAIDLFLNTVTKTLNKGAVHYSLYIVLFYVGCYVAAGFFGGLINIKIINKIRASGNETVLFQKLNGLMMQQSPPLIHAIPPKKKRSGFWIIGILMLALLITSYLPFFSNRFAKWDVLKIFFRAAIILIAWIFLITPLLQKQIQKWMKRYQEKKAGPIQQVVALLPGIRQILKQSWELSQQPKKWLHFKSFISITVLLIVHYEQ